MTSKALQIRDAIIAKLSSPALSGLGTGGISTDPDYAFEARDLPVVAVFLGDESAPDHAFIGHYSRTLNLSVRVISKGNDAFAAGDDILVQAHQRVMSDSSLGGLAMDIQQRATRRTREVLEMPVAVTEVDYAVDYRTLLDSLEN